MQFHQTYSAPHDIIAARRTELAMSQSELARRLGLKHPSFISMLEAQRSPFPLSRTLQFIKVLELDPAWFIEKVMTWEAEGTKPEQSLKELGEYIFSEEFLKAALAAKTRKAA